ncbi:MAG: hypothetical protein E6G97_00020 [Alphaproteobacteria bacterium]|nr:MAG: hypothetical protein E6G97_00020 [Alphaproteobacteria bacterium]
MAGRLSFNRVHFLAALALAVGMKPASAQDVPQLQSNQAYVEDVSRATTLDVNDPMAVFGFVMSKLPERVKVYPTENYYYFGFMHNGIRYAGNIRLDASNRDDGKVIFAYFEDTSQWYDDAPVQHAILDAAQGITVEKVEPLVYRITYQGKSVVFALNDLRNVKPPATALGPDETFIGPIFDESAIRFFLVYNPKLKIFHYLLDETEKVADSFFPAKKSDRILIGKRTGFAFYKDHRRDRKILIGAFAGNIQANNYFDGPFDQLPDNFIEGDALRQAILQVQPALKGQIDRFGAAPDGSIRFMIGPYLPYQAITDLDPIHACAQKKQKQPDYYRCFVTDDESGGMVAPRPNKRRPR